jgi:hypothetical protein
MHWRSASLSPAILRDARAAARWDARYCTEQQSVTLAESQLVLAALAALPDGLGATAGVEALAPLTEQRGLERITQALDAWTR